MKNFMEAEHFTDVRFFDRINDASDRVKQAACGKQEHCAKWQASKCRKIYGDEPAHQDIQSGAQFPGCIDPEELHHDSCKRDAPDRADQHDVFRCRQDRVEKRRIRARDEDVNHGMIQLAQFFDHCRRSVGKMVEAAGAIQSGQGEAENQSHDLCIVEMPHEDFHDHDNGTYHG